MSTTRKSLIDESIDIAVNYLSSAIRNLYEGFYNGALFTDITNERIFHDLKESIKQMADLANPVNNAEDITVFLNPRAVLKRERDFEKSILFLTQTLIDLKDIDVNYELPNILEAINALVDILANVQERNQRYRAQIKARNKLYRVK